VVDVVVVVDIVIDVVVVVLGTVDADVSSDIVVDVLVVVADKVLAPPPTGHFSESFTISPFVHTYLVMVIFSASCIGQSLLPDTMLPSQQTYFTRVTASGFSEVHPLIRITVKIEKNIKNAREIPKIESFINMILDRKNITSDHRTEK
jgi:hypothetical protein